MANSELDLYLNSMLEQVDTFEDYEAEEALENLAQIASRKSDATSLRKIAQARTALKRTQAGKAWGQTQPVAGSGGGNKAMFTIAITRVTANINESLPVALFGANESSSAYENLLTPLLPSGVLLDTVAIGRDNTGIVNRKVAVFSFKDALANTDTIRVECKQVPYPDLLHATGSDAFRLSNIRYGISDTTQLAQFENEVVLSTQSLFGARRQDKLTPSAYKAPDQYQSGIIDLTGVVMNIDAETSIANSIVPSAGLVVSYNVFVEKIHKVGRQQLG